MVEHAIGTGSSHPIKQRHCRTLVAFWSEEEKEVKSMLEQGIIEPSNSPWYSSVCLVRKKDGSIRFCVDYKLLNDCPIKDSYPLPRISDCLDSLVWARYFSMMNLASWYWQIRVKEEDRPKTAFVIKTGLYQFLVIPFGLANAPKYFRKMYGINPEGRAMGYMSYLSWRHHCFRMVSIWYDWASESCANWFTQGWNSNPLSAIFMQGRSIFLGMWFLMKELVQTQTRFMWLLAGQPLHLSLTFTHSSVCVLIIGSLSRTLQKLQIPWPGLPGRMYPFSGIPNLKKLWIHWRIVWSNPLFFHILIHQQTLCWTVMPVTLE